MGSCVLVLDPAGVSAYELVTLLEGRLTHTHPSDRTARLKCAAGRTTTQLKSAHRILQEWLAQLAPDTNTNGHTYQGLLQILARRLGTNTHKYHGLILEMPAGVEDTSELATVLADLKILQRTHQGLSILVTASPRHVLPPDLFTAIVRIPEPTPNDLKPIVRSIAPAASDEMVAFIVAHACKLHTYNLARTASNTDTATALANIVTAANADTEISHQTVTTAVHTLIGRTVIEKLTLGGGPRSTIYTPGIVAAAIAAHDTIKQERERENISLSASSSPHDPDDTVWMPINTIYHQFLTLAHQNLTAGSPHLLFTPGQKPYLAFNKAIPAIIASGLLVTHPSSGKPMVALNPILTDTRIIPSILNPPQPEQNPTTADNRCYQQPQPTPTPERVDHIALLAALVKTEQNTHPSLFPTHRSIYSTYQTVCAKLNTLPKPLAKIYRSIQSLRKLGVIHVHRAYNKQGRPNQLLHHLSPNDTAKLRATIHAIKYPKFIANTDILEFNAHIANIISSLKSTHKRNVITTLAAIAAKSNRNMFNASNAYSLYAQSTPKPIPKHTFLATIRRLIKDNILTPLCRTANLALNLTISLPAEPLKPPP